MLTWPFTENVEKTTFLFKMADMVELSKPLTSVKHRVFYCVARTWVVIGCQHDLLLLGRLLWMNLRCTRCKLCFSRDALVKGLQSLIITRRLSIFLITQRPIFPITRRPSIFPITQRPIFVITQRPSIFSITWRPIFSITLKTYCYSSMSEQVDVLSLFPLDLLYFITGYYSDPNYGLEGSATASILLRLPRLLKVHSYVEFVEKFENRTTRPNIFRYVSWYWRATTVVITVIIIL